jgi:hypothetical protein
VDEIVRAELQNQVRPQVSIRIEIIGIEWITGAIQVPDIGSIASFFNRRRIRATLRWPLIRGVKRERIGVRSRPFVIQWRGLSENKFYWE